MPCPHFWITPGKSPWGKRHSKDTGRPPQVPRNAVSGPLPVPSGVDCYRQKFPEFALRVRPPRTRLLARRRARSGTLPDAPRSTAMQASMGATSPRPSPRKPSRGVKPRGWTPRRDLKEARQVSARVGAVPSSTTIYQRFVLSWRLSSFQPRVSTPVENSPFLGILAPAVTTSPC